MPNKKLVIHIGTHKTGTTSIQNSLGASRKAMLQQGIYYPSLTPYNHGFNFLQLFKRDPKQFLRYIIKDFSEEAIEQDLKKLKQAWRQQFELFNNSEAETFIISGEALSHLHEDEVLKLKQFVTPYFDTIQIVAYVRPFKPYITSMVQQMVKQGIHSLDECKDFTTGLISPLTFTDSIKCWLEIFGEDIITIRPFNPKAFYKKNLIADFINTIGYPHFDTSVIAESKMNESIGMNGTALLSELNATYPLCVDGKVNKERGLAQTILPRKIYARVKDEKFTLDILFNEQEAKLFNEAIAFFNQYFPVEFALPKVEATEQLTEFPYIHQINAPFYVELINEYHKEIELHYKTHHFHEQLFQLAGTNRQVYIWGAGVGGLNIKQLVSKLNVEIVAFIDSSLKKEGTIVDDTPVMLPTILNSVPKEDVFVIVGSVYAQDIVKTLKEFGLQENEHFIAKYIY